jgi:hypothetical protein
MEGYGRTAYGSYNIYYRIATDTIDIIAIVGPQDLNDLL